MNSGPDSTNHQNNLTTAREIFDRHHGSHFSMDRNEEYNQYKSLGISKDQEREWAIDLAARFYQMLTSAIDAQERIHWMIAVYLIITQYQMHTELQLFLDYYISNKEKIARFECLLVAEQCIEALRDKSFPNMTKKLMAAAESLLITVKQREYSFPEGKSMEGSDLETYSEKAMDNRIKRAEAELARISKTLISA